jgi:hypothetical protein
MRLRIEAARPLPPMKTWFSFSPGIFGFGTRTINDLRTRLVAELHLPPHIQLQKDGYDLLGKQPLEDLLEKDDLITFFHSY